MKCYFCDKSTRILFFEHSSSICVFNVGSFSVGYTGRKVKNNGNVLEENRNKKIGGARNIFRYEQSCIISRGLEFSKGASRTAILNFLSKYFEKSRVRPHPPLFER